MLCYLFCYYNFLQKMFPSIVLFIIIIIIIIIIIVIIVIINNIFI